MRKHGQVIAFSVIAVGAGLLCWGLVGPQAVADGARDALALTITVIPQIALGLLIAGFAYVLLPKERVARMLGARSGLRGICLASLIGALVPGGPFASFPLIHALARSGADIGAVMAFLTSWAAVGLHRLFVWELPLMGVDFGLLRFLACLPLPILAGIFARNLVGRYAFLRPDDVQ